MVCLHINLEQKGGTMRPEGVLQAQARFWPASENKPDEDGEANLKRHHKRSLSCCLAFSGTRDI